jgi:hypothetical protein
MICGGASGFLSEGLLHPIDVIKTRLQSVSNEKFNSINDVIRKTLYKDGPRGFFKGFSVVITTGLPITALYFLSYELSVRMYDKLLPHSDTLGKQFLSGMTAQVFAGLMFTPRDIIKERLQIQVGDRKLYNGPVDAVKKIIAQNGIRGLYKGYWESLALWGPYGGIYLALYDWFKSTRQRQKRAELSTGDLLFSSGSAAAISAFVTCPIDNVKLNLQTSTNSELNSGLKLAKYQYKQEGLKFFFRGVSARLLWVTPRTMLLFLTYERFKSLLIGRR